MSGYATFEVEAGKLRDWADAVAEYVEKGPLFVDDDGVHACTADPAMVGTVDYRLKDGFFARWSVEENGRVGVNYDILLQILKKFGKKTELDVVIGLDGITLQGENGQARLENIELEDDEQQDIDLDELEPDVGARVTTGKFDSMVSACGIFGDAVELHTTGKDVRMEASNEHGETEHGLDYIDEAPSSPHVIEIELDYLKRASKRLKKLDSGLRVRYSDDRPLHLEVSNDELEFSYVIAPRIEEE
jgi:DNA polymerase III sliding clamp (beta) subunit (PCNA family)